MFQQSDINHISYLLFQKQPSAEVTEDTIFFRQEMMNLTIFDEEGNVLRLGRDLAVSYSNRFYRYRKIDLKITERKVNRIFRVSTSFQERSKINMFSITNTSRSIVTREKCSSKRWVLDPTIFWWIRRKQKQRRAWPNIEKRWKMWKKWHSVPHRSTKDSSLSV